MSTLRPGIRPVSSQRLLNIGDVQWISALVSFYWPPHSLSQKHKYIQSLLYWRFELRSVFWWPTFSGLKHQIQYINGRKKEREKEKDNILKCLFEKRATIVPSCQAKSILTFDLRFAEGLRVTQKRASRLGQNSKPLCDAGLPLCFERHWEAKWVNHVFPSSALSWDPRGTFASLWMDSTDPILGSPHPPAATQCPSQN